MDRHVPQAHVTTSLPDPPPSRLADIRSLWLAILIIGGSIVVQAAGRITDISLHRAPSDPAEIWLLEVISHIAILCLIPPVLMVLDRAPLQRGAWGRSAVVHLFGALGFAGAHIVIMWAARELSFPPVLDRPYDGDLLEPARLFAEVRKDVFIYAILALGLAGNRAIERHRDETRAARVQARTTGAVTLRSGGHTYIVNAVDIVSATAAENYVEIQTAAKNYLARMTLTQLERLLADAGTRHARVHRSHIVNLQHVVSVAPTGEGDVLITLSTGAVVPGSRRFRNRLAFETK